MSEHHFELEPEVHIAREHCPQCRKLDAELRQYRVYLPCSGCRRYAL